MQQPLLLTGRPGCGKTTVVQRVASSLQAQGRLVQGFYTREIREQGRRRGFEIVTLPEGHRGLLARVEPGDAGPRIGRYRVYVSTLEELVLPLLVRMPPQVALVVIDEIGSMELLSEAFRQQVLRLLKAPPACILATIQERQVRRFLEPHGLLEAVDLWRMRFGEAEEVSRRILRRLQGCSGR